MPPIQISNTKITKPVTNGIFTLAKKLNGITQIKLLVGSSHRGQLVKFEKAFSVNPDVKIYRNTIFLLLAYNLKCF